MLYTQTIAKLQALRLEGMVQALEEQRRQNDIAGLDFEDRLAMLVERQWLWRENRGLAVRLKNAQFKITASLEDLDYRSSRGLKRAQIEQLRASQWVKEHRNCLITGPTGSGKTYLACAVGAQACREGYRTLYFYAPKFFRTLESARSRRQPPGLAQEVGAGTAAGPGRPGHCQCAGKTLPRVPGGPR